MQTAYLEHLNITVGDADKTAQRLCQIFDWTIRWSGPSIHGGRSVHVGSDDHYLALYNAAPKQDGIRPNYSTPNGLNHVGIVVDDLQDAEARVIKAGYTPFSHQNYEPGKRFYFMGDDNVEYEVVSYAPKPASLGSQIWSELGRMARYSAQMK